ncbi:hypothetical protein [Alkalimonas amylolytica]|uniref:Uncharacterized protein n=1 Tax=Alkalimonas amylolytica TaxID=152573 RepID=A0A1H3XIC7_ALKAM|nr:hypothetical protein [Alkalimonas amylolytica]SDZ99109.1 hypothetical protein SAMN04488051_101259 [Alkalimonas amylolytica]
MLDYSLYYRRPIRTDKIPEELPKFDIFLSAYNSSFRVNKVFEDVRSEKKVWVIHPEYKYTIGEYPSEGIKVTPPSTDEISQVTAILAELGDLEGKKICIDTTGFMRHVLIFLTAKLSYLEVKEFTALYSEPKYYSKQEDTTFTTATTGEPRPVNGLYGNKSGQEFLIINVGYDHKLIGEVADNKEGAIIYPIFSFPSLSPDMYQQSALRASDGGGAALDSAWINNRYFAPANDPFTTAGVISEIVDTIDRNYPDANIYLSPLSTKIQSLGFSIYWLFEGKARKGVTMLLPECITYSRETSTGLKRLWCYSIEL